MKLPLLVAKCAAVLLAGAALLVPAPVPLVDGWYATRFYPSLQRALTGVSNLVPFALFDVLVAALVTWIIAELVRVLRRADRRWRASGGALARLGVTVAILYLTFLGAWGLNYRRSPLTERLEFSAARVTPDAIERVARVTAADLNRLRPAGLRFAVPPAGAWPAALAAPFARAQAAMGLPGDATPGRPKWSILDPYFTRAGISGMTDPFFLETLVASNVLPFERAAVVAHEWGHLAGFARESEASFFGWVLCLQSGAAARYSGQLELFVRLLGSLDPKARAAVLAGVNTGVAADLAAMAERDRQAQVPAVTRAAWRVYDRYLRTNRVASGIRNYDEVVTLVVGTTFAADGVPSRRQRER